MTQIKNKFFIINLLTFLICFNSCYSQNEKLKKPITLELTASLGGSGGFLDTIGVIYITTTLYNPTPDTIKFVSMTCSYEDFFTTNTDTFKIQSRYDCYSNYPTVVTLPPMTKTDRYIMVTRTLKGKNVDTSKFKVGMYYLEYQKGKISGYIIKLYENRQNAEVIWSNELDLKRFYKTNY
jgi:hypothetical protein